MLSNISKTATLSAAAAVEKGSEEIEVYDIEERQIERSGESYVNWAGNIRFEPLAIETPKTLAELQSIIRDAEVVHAVGKGHSSSPVAQTEGVLVKMAQLNRVLSVDSRNKTVTVEAGIEFGPLDKALAEHGLALRTAPGPREMTIGGAVATGSGGSGLRHGSLSDEVIAMEVLDSKGNLRKITDPETLKTMRTSLGALGVVYSLTLKTEDRHRKQMTREVMDEDTAFASAVKMARENEYVDMTWMLGEQKVYVRKANRTDAPVKMPSKFRQWVDYVLRGPVANLLLALGSRFPSLRPTLEKQALAGLPTDAIVDWSDNVIHNTLGTAKVAIRAAIDEVGYKSTVPFLVRFVGKGAGTTIGHIGNEEVITFDIITVPGQKDADAFYAAVERRLRALGGKPHLGKLSVENVASTHTQEEWAQFAKVQKWLDPDGKFENAFVSDVLVSAGADRLV